MKGPIRWMTENHVAANLLMAVLIIGGILKGPEITQEVFPEIDLDRVQVTVVYPGAGPEEVEEGILLKLEESLSGLDGIKQLKASASEGSASSPPRFTLIRMSTRCCRISAVKSIVSPPSPTMLKRRWLARCCGAAR